MTSGERKGGGGGGREGGGVFGEGKNNVVAICIVTGTSLGASKIFVAVMRDARVGWDCLCSFVEDFE